jgi:hypothetical protein
MEDKVNYKCTGQAPKQDDEASYHAWKRRVREGADPCSVYRDGHSDGFDDGVHYIRKQGEKSDERLREALEWLNMNEDKDTVVIEILESILNEQEESDE